MTTLLSIVLSNALLVLPLAILAAGVAALGRRPALAHGLWLLVLLKLVTPPFIALPVPAFTWTEATPAVAEAAPPPPTPDLCGTRLTFEYDLMPAEPDPVDEVEPLVELLPPPRPETPVAVAALPPAEPTEEASSFSFSAFALPVLGLLWLTGSAAWLALTAVRLRRFQRLLRHAVPAPPELRRQAESVAARLGLPGCPEVQLLPGSLSPMLWGLFGSSRLLLPAQLFARLDAEQRATLLAHELAHLRRRDHWVRGLEVIATACWWWHPVLWWARRELREAEEQCCDAWVVWALPGAAKQYATALVETVDFLADDRSALPALASGAGQFPILKRRLTMILRGTPPRTLSTAGLFGVIGLGALLLPIVPTWAQDPAPRPERKEIKIVEADTVKFFQADPKKAEEVEKARLELKKLADEMNRMHEQFRNAQKHFEEAAKKLAQLEGGEGKRFFLFEKKIDGPGFPGGPDVLQFKLRLDGPGADHSARKQDELRFAEKELDELKKNIETIKQLVKDNEGGKQATAALEIVLKRKAAEVEARRAELAQLEAERKAGPKVFTRPIGPEDEVAIAKLKAKEAELLAVAKTLEAAQAGLSHLRKVHESGAVSPVALKQAEVTVAKLEAELLTKKAELLELQARLKQPAQHFTRPVAPPAGGHEQRLADLEKRLAELLREVQGLRQNQGGPSGREPGTPRPPVAPLTPPAALPRR